MGETGASSVADIDEGGVPATVIMEPEYTIKDIVYLFLTLGAAYFAAFGLSHFLDVPHWSRWWWVEINWSDTKYELNLIFYYGAIFNLIYRLLRFCWRHRGDLPVWVALMVGGGGSAHVLCLLCWRDDILDAFTVFMPWTYLGSLLVYVYWRLRWHGGRAMPMTVGEEEWERKEEERVRRQRDFTKN
ncbi:hypothetical protein PG995_014490 [Apiospora arundinis]